MPRSLFLLLAPYAVLYLVHALAPEIQPDGYTYHLALARQWLRGGPSRIGFYEMMPQGAEMLFAPAYALAGAVGPKLVHFAFLCGLLPLMLAAARRLGASPWAAAMVWCAPVVGIDGTSAYNDVMLAFFALTSFVLLLDGKHFLAGLAAGACYAIKMTGGLLIPAGLVYVLVKRPRGAPRFAAAAALMVLPWLIRSAWLTGNPLAPLFNRVFPNPHFHISTVEKLTEFLATYGVSRWTLPWEVTMRGEATGGLLGPAFLLAPLVILLWRRDAVRWPLIFAAFAAIPWFWNAGTRFLIPAACFAALAVPVRAAPALAVLQAILCLPFVLDSYTPAGSWHLRGFPLAAALRQENEVDYLRRNLPEYARAGLLNREVKRGEAVLDLSGAPTAYVEADALGPWQYAAADRAAESLRMAATHRRGMIHELRADWQPLVLEGVRLLITGRAEQPWSMQEVTVFEAGGAVFPSSAWRLTADPNPWETPLALDRNPVSRWTTWRESRPGMQFTIEFGEPRRIEGIRAMVWQPWKDMPVIVQGLEPGRNWHAIVAEPSFREVKPLNWRKQAALHLRREGFRYVLAPEGAAAWGPVGSDLAARAGDWGVEVVGRAAGATLFRVR